jgi:hypothetical protein
MARLTDTGILFSSGNELNSKRQIFALNTAWTFYQNTTPTGWTKVTTHNDKSLRVVAGDGGGSGGTNSFTSTFSPKTIGGSFNFSVGGGDHPLTTPQIAAHSHDNDGEIGVSGHPAVFNPDGTQTGWSGGDVARPPSGNSAWVRNSPSTGGITLGGVGGVVHSHPNTAASATVSDTTVTLDVQYIDIIVCTFDG